MNLVSIDIEVVKAIGLSTVFLGVMLSLVAIGISFLLYRLSKNKGREYLKMAWLILAWAIFISLNSQTSASLNYNPIWFFYSLAHLVSMVIAAITIVMFLLFFNKFWEYFNRKFLIIAGIFAGLSLLMRIIFPIFSNPYLSFLQRIVVIIPPLIGLFMIIKSYIGKDD